MTHSPWFFRIQAGWAVLIVLLAGILPAIVGLTSQRQGMSIPLGLLCAYMTYVALGVPGKLLAFAKQADAEVRTFLLGPLLPSGYVYGFYMLIGALIGSHIGIIAADANDVALPITSLQFSVGMFFLLGFCGIWLDVRIAQLKRSITPKLGPNH